MLSHTSAAMTLDVYADLFDSDLDSAADNVAKLAKCSQNAAKRSHGGHRHRLKIALTSAYGLGNLEPPVRIELMTAGLPPGEPSASFRPTGRHRPRRLAPPPARVGAQLRQHHPVIESSWLTEPAPAALAQLVERRPCKANGESSSLSRGSIPVGNEG